MVDANPEVKVLVLDAVQGIQIKSTDPITVGYQTFMQNIYGLQLLAANIRQHEVREMLNGKSVIRFDINANPNFAAQFNWFSLTFNNHMRQIALVDLMQQKGWTTADLIANDKETAKHCTAYAMSVDADLYRWRNKVAAHSAATDPAVRRDVSKSDTEKLLQQSVWINLFYQSPYFTVGNMRPQGMSDSEALPIWALTERFERHQQRFWPTFGIERIPPRPGPVQPKPHVPSHAHMFGIKGQKR